MTSVRRQSGGVEADSRWTVSDTSCLIGVCSTLTRSGAAARNAAHPLTCDKRKGWLHQYYQRCSVYKGSFMKEGYTFCSAVNRSFWRLGVRQTYVNKKIALTSAIDHWGTILWKDSPAVDGPHFKKLFRCDNAPWLNNCSLMIAFTRVNDLKIKVGISTEVPRSRWPQLGLRATESVNSLRNKVVVVVVVVVDARPESYSFPLGGKPLVTY